MARISSTISTSSGSVGSIFSKSGLVPHSSMQQSVQSSGLQLPVAMTAALRLVLQVGDGLRPPLCRLDADTFSIAMEKDDSPKEASLSSFDNFFGETQI
ncbi:hypothetical protein QYF36_014157 [Acer negundo]|nr:hypothetical protein QYF36_014157 [Acer negundo]